jgi:dTDP-4-amino-4,6-dideoxygalactose transaminase
LDIENRRAVLYNHHESISVSGNRAVYFYFQGIGRLIVVEEKLVEHERKTAGRSYGGRELEYLEEALKSGKLSGLNGGTFTGRFETEFARMLGAGHAVAMNSCMSALHAALICAEAFAGSEVVCDSEFVFGSLAALYNNAIPVFVDIDPVTHNMDPDKLESARRDSAQSSMTVRFRR